MKRNKSRYAWKVYSVRLPGTHRKILEDFLKKIRSENPGAKFTMSQAIRIALYRGTK